LVYSGEARKVKYNISPLQNDFKFMRFGNVTSGGIYSSKDESINQNSKNGVKQSKQNIFINNLQNISEWIPSSKNFKNDNNSNNMMKNGM
jgi:hypothetical protein